MTTFQLLSNYWHFNVWIILTALLMVFIHMYGNGYKFTRQSKLFLTGVLLFLLVTLSPLDFLAESYLFSAHMIKHIILLLIVPALLLSGMNAAFLERIINRPRVRSVTKVIFHPLVAWMSGVGAMWFWHVPALFGIVKTSPFLQVAHLVSLLGLGIIFNWPVFAPLKWQRVTYLQSVLYLFSACVGCTVLGILITFAPAELYAIYFHGSNPSVLQLVNQKWGITSDVDQQAGGLIMWVPACFVYLTDIMINLGRWYRLDRTTYSVKLSNHAN